MLASSLLYIEQKRIRALSAAKMKLLVKVDNDFQSLTIFAKSSILDVPPFSKS